MQFKRNTPQHRGQSATTANRCHTLRMANTGDRLMKAILQPIDIAVALGVSPWTARRLCRDGAFPGAFLLGEVGSQWRIPREDLEAFIQRRREATREVPKREGEPVIYTLPRTECW